MATAVGAPQTQERRLAEKAVVPKAVAGNQTHKDAFDRFQIGRRQHVARYLHRVDDVAGGEGEGVVAHRVALVVVLHSVGEVDGVGGVGLERVVEVHANLLALGTHVGGLQLRRRNDDLLVGVLQFDVFVEIDAYLLRQHTCGTVLRTTLHHVRRLLVVASAVGRADAGTGGEQEPESAHHHLAEAQRFALSVVVRVHTFIFNSSSIC